MLLYTPATGVSYITLFSLPQHVVESNQPVDRGCIGGNRDRLQRVESHAIRWFTRWTRGCYHDCDSQRQRWTVCDIYAHVNVTVVLMLHLILLLDAFSSLCCIEVRAVHVDRTCARCCRCAMPVSVPIGYTSRIEGICVCAHPYDIRLDNIVVVEYTNVSRCARLCRCVTDDALNLYLRLDDSARFTSLSLFPVHHLNDIRRTRRTATRAPTPSTIQTLSSMFRAIFDTTGFISAYVMIVPTGMRLVPVAAGTPLETIATYVQFLSSDVFAVGVCFIVLSASILSICISTLRLYWIYTEDERSITSPLATTHDTTVEYISGTLTYPFRCVSTFMGQHFDGIGKMLNDWVSNIVDRSTMIGWTGCLFALYASLCVHTEFDPVLNSYTRCGGIVLVSMLWSNYHTRTRIGCMILTSIVYASIVGYVACGIGRTRSDPDECAVTAILVLSAVYKLYESKGCVFGAKDTLATIPPNDTSAELRAAHLSYLAEFNQTNVTTGYTCLDQSIVTMMHRLFTRNVLSPEERRFSDWTYAPGSAVVLMFVRLTGILEYSDQTITNSVIRRIILPGFDIDGLFRWIQTTFGPNIPNMNTMVSVDCIEFQKSYHAVIARLAAIVSNPIGRDQINLTDRPIVYSLQKQTYCSTRTRHYLSIIIETMYKMHPSDRNITDIHKTCTELTVKMLESLYLLESTATVFLYTIIGRLAMSYGVCGGMDILEESRAHFASHVPQYTDSTSDMYTRAISLLGCTRRSSMDDKIKLVFVIMGLYNLTVPPEYTGIEHVCTSDAWVKCTTIPVKVTTSIISVDLTKPQPSVVSRKWFPIGNDTVVIGIPTPDRNARAELEAVCRGPIVHTLLATHTDRPVHYPTSTNTRRTFAAFEYAYPNNPGISITLYNTFSRIFTGMVVDGVFIDGPLSMDGNLPCPPLKSLFEFSADPTTPDAMRIAYVMALMVNSFGIPYEQIMAVIDAAAAQSGLFVISHTPTKLVVVDPDDLMCITTNSVTIDYDLRLLYVADPTQSSMYRMIQTNLWTMVEADTTLFGHNPTIAPCDLIATVTTHIHQTKSATDRREPESNHVIALLPLLGIVHGDELSAFALNMEEEVAVHLVRTTMCGAGTNPLVSALVIPPSTIGIGARIGCHTVTRLCTAVQHESPVSSPVQSGVVPRIETTPTSHAPATSQPEKISDYDETDDAHMYKRARMNVNGNFNLNYLFYAGVGLSQLFVPVECVRIDWFEYIINIDVTVVCTDHTYVLDNYILAMAGIFGLLCTCICVCNCINAGSCWRRLRRASVRKDTIITSPISTSPSPQMYVPEPEPIKVTRYRKRCEYRAANPPGPFRKAPRVLFAEPAGLNVMTYTMFTVISLATVVDAAGLTHSQTVACSTLCLACVLLKPTLVVVMGMSPTTFIPHQESRTVCKLITVGYYLMCIAAAGYESDWEFRGVYQVLCACVICTYLFGNSRQIWGLDKHEPDQCVTGTPTPYQRCIQHLVISKLYRQLMDEYGISNVIIQIISVELWSLETPSVRCSYGSTNNPYGGCIILVRVRDAVSNATYPMYIYDPVLSRLGLVTYSTWRTTISCYRVVMTILSNNQCALERIVYDGSTTPVNYRTRASAIIRCLFPTESISTIAGILNTPTCAGKTTPILADNNQTTTSDVTVSDINAAVALLTLKGESLSTVTPDAEHCKPPDTTQRPPTHIINYPCPSTLKPRIRTLKRPRILTPTRPIRRVGRPQLYPNNSNLNNLKYRYQPSAFKSISTALKVALVAMINANAVTVDAFYPGSQQPYILTDTTTVQSFWVTIATIALPTYIILTRISQTCNQDDKQTRTWDIRDAPAGYPIRTTTSGRLLTRDTTRTGRHGLLRTPTWFEVSYVDLRDSCRSDETTSIEASPMSIQHTHTQPVSNRVDTVNFLSVLIAVSAIWCLTGYIPFKSTGDAAILLATYLCIRCRLCIWGSSDPEPGGSNRPVNQSKRRRIAIVDTDSSDDDVPTLKSTVSTVPARTPVAATTSPRPVATPARVTTAVEQPVHTHSKSVTVSPAAHMVTTPVVQTPPVVTRKSPSLGIVVTADEERAQMLESCINFVRIISNWKYRPLQTGLAQQSAIMPYLSVSHQDLFKTRRHFYTHGLQLADGMLSLFLPNIYDAIRKDIDKETAAKRDTKDIRENLSMHRIFKTLYIGLQHRVGLKEDVYDLDCASLMNTLRCMVTGFRQSRSCNGTLHIDEDGSKMYIAWADIRMLGHLVDYNVDIRVSTIEPHSSEPGFGPNFVWTELHTCNLRTITLHIIWEPPSRNGVQWVLDNEAEFAEHEIDVYGDNTTVGEYTTDKRMIVAMANRYIKYVHTGKSKKKPISIQRTLVSTSSFRLITGSDGVPLINEITESTESSPSNIITICNPLINDVNNVHRKYIKYVTLNGCTNQMIGVGGQIAHEQRKLPKAAHLEIEANNGDIVATWNISKSKSDTNTSSSRKNNPKSVENGKQKKPKRSAFIDDEADVEDDSEYERYKRDKKRHAIDNNDIESANDDDDDDDNYDDDEDEVGSLADFVLDDSSDSDNDGVNDTERHKQRRLAEKELAKMAEARDRADMLRWKRAKASQIPVYDSDDDTAIKNRVLQTIAACASEAYTDNRVNPVKPTGGVSMARSDILKSIPSARNETAQTTHTPIRAAPRTHVNPIKLVESGEFSGSDDVSMGNNRAQSAVDDSMNMDDSEESEEIQPNQLAMSSDYWETHTVDISASDVEEIVKGIERPNDNDQDSPPPVSRVSSVSTGARIRTGSRSKHKNPSPPITTRRKIVIETDSGSDDDMFDTRRRKVSHSTEHRVSSKRNNIRNNPNARTVSPQSEDLLAHVDTDESTTPQPGQGDDRDTDRAVVSHLSNNTDSRQHTAAVFAKSPHSKLLGDSDNDTDEGGTCITNTLRADTATHAAACPSQQSDHVEDAQTLGDWDNDDNCSQYTETPPPVAVNMNHPPSPVNNGITGTGNGPDGDDSGDGDSDIDDIRDRCNYDGHIIAAPTTTPIYYGNAYWEYIKSLIVGTDPDEHRIRLLTFAGEGNTQLLPLLGTSLKQSINITHLAEHFDEVSGITEPASDVISFTNCTGARRRLYTTKYTSVSRETRSQLFTTFRLWFMLAVLYTQKFTNGTGFARFSDNPQHVVSGEQGNRMLNLIIDFETGRLTPNLDGLHTLLVRIIECMELFGILKNSAEMSADCILSLILNQLTPVKTQTQGDVNIAWFTTGSISAIQVYYQMFERIGIAPCNFKCLYHMIIGSQHPSTGQTIVVSPVHVLSMVIHRLDKYFESRVQATGLCRSPSKRVKLNRPKHLITMFRDAYRQQSIGTGNQPRTAIYSKWDKPTISSISHTEWVNDYRDNCALPEFYRGLIMHYGRAAVLPLFENFGRFALWLKNATFGKFSNKPSHVIVTADNIDLTTRQLLCIPYTCESKSMLVWIFNSPDVAVDVLRQFVENHPHVPITYSDRASKTCNTTSNGGPTASVLHLPMIMSDVDYALRFFLPVYGCAVLKSGYVIHGVRPLVLFGGDAGTGKSILIAGLSGVLNDSDHTAGRLSTSMMASVGISKSFDVTTQVATTCVKGPETLGMVPAFGSLCIDEAGDTSADTKEPQIVPGLNNTYISSVLAGGGMVNGLTPKYSNTSSLAGTTNITLDGDPARKGDRNQIAGIAVAGNYNYLAAVAKLSHFNLAAGEAQGNMIRRTIAIPMLQNTTDELAKASMLSNAKLFESVCSHLMRKPPSYGQLGTFPYEPGSHPNFKELSMHNEFDWALATIIAGIRANPPVPGKISDYTYLTTKRPDITRVDVSGSTPQIQVLSELLHVTEGRLTQWNHVFNICTTTSTVPTDDTGLFTLTDIGQYQLTPLTIRSTAFLNRVQLLIPLRYTVLAVPLTSMIKIIRILSPAIANDTSNANITHKLAALAGMSKLKLLSASCSSTRQGCYQIATMRVSASSDKLITVHDPRLDATDASSFSGCVIGCNPFVEHQITYRHPVGSEPISRCSRIIVSIPTNMITVGYAGL